MPNIITTHMRDDATSYVYGHKQPQYERYQQYGAAQIYREHLKSTHQNISSNEKVLLVFVRNSMLIILSSTLSLP